MGIMFICQSMGLVGGQWAFRPYYMTSLLFNTLLTPMIAIRLILYAKNIRTPMGEIGSGRLYNAIVTMLSESYTISGVTSSVLALTDTGDDSASIYMSIFTETQVRAFP